MNVNFILKLAQDFEEMIPETLRVPYSSSNINFSEPVIDVELSPEILELDSYLSELDSENDILFYILKSIKEDVKSAKSALLQRDKEQVYMDLDTYLYKIKRTFNSFENSLKRIGDMKEKLKQITNAHVNLSQQD